FGAKSGAEEGRVRSEVGNRTKLPIPGIGAANDDGKGIVEAERLGDLQAKALGVMRFHSLVNLRGIARGLLAEHHGERSARVLNVEVDLSRAQRFVADQRTP